MMEPIYDLLFTDSYSLKLTEDEVKVFYRRYQSDNTDDMKEIIDQKLAPGKSGCSRSA